MSDDGVALAGFEPASIHAKRPIGKRASHAQPLGHATVHPQPRSQPTPSCRGSRSWAPLSRFRFHVFPVSCRLLHRAVEVAGVEPAYLCLQGSDPSRRRPRSIAVPPSGIEPAPSGLQPDAQTTYARGAKRSPWESNPPGSVGQTDRLTRGVGEQTKRLRPVRESNPPRSIERAASWPLDERDDVSQ